MNGITVSVEFGDLLEITLPRNARHFERVMVVSVESDDKTREVTESVPNAALFTTDAFYRQGAAFNKGLAMEEGLDELGREGWMCIWDADTLMPENPDWTNLREGCLHTPARRMLYDPAYWRPDLDWLQCPPLNGPDPRIHPTQELAGYCQVFHASDPVLQRRAWYGVKWPTASGCDSDFEALWPPDRRIWLPWDVLHLGPDGVNWCGRVTRLLEPSEHGGYTAGGRPAKAKERMAAIEQLFTSRNVYGIQKEWL